MYLVTGAGGFLGSYVIKHILNDTEDEVFAVTRNGCAFGSSSERVQVLTCDLAEETDKVIRAVSGFNGMKVIHLCAEHNMDTVARQPEQAKRLNETALRRLADGLSPECFFFASTDAVYGEGGDYRFKEEDALSPLSLYGQQKMQGERIVLSRGFNVLRLPYMFGESISPYKKHFFDFIARELSEGRSVCLYTDSIRSTLSFDTVARVAVKLCERYTEKLPKILNVAGDEALSKAEIGFRLAEEKGWDRGLITPAKSPESYPDGAERARSTLMDNTLLKKSIGEKELRFRIGAQ